MHIRLNALLEHPPRRIRISHLASTIQRIDGLPLKYTAPIVPLYCGASASTIDGNRGSSQVEVRVLWSTKYLRRVDVVQISQLEGRVP